MQGAPDSSCGRKLAACPGPVRVAFAKTAESREIDRLIDNPPEPPVGPQRREYTGKFNVRIPKSLHAAVANEAEAEGVSLNQLVVAKLALHLQRR